MKRTTALNESELERSLDLSRELKVYDLNTTDYAVDNVGSITLIYNPRLGSDYNQRNGRIATIEYIHIKGALSTLASSTNAVIASPRQHLRCIIFMDMQPNGTPSTTDVLNTAQPSSYLNLNNRRRFVIISDKDYVLDPYVYDGVALASTVNQVEYIQYDRRWKQDIVFKANGGTIADIGTGALYMMWLGDQGSGSGQESVFTGAVRVRYFDS